MFTVYIVQEWGCFLTVSNRQTLQFWTAVDRLVIVPSPFNLEIYLDSRTSGVHEWHKWCRQNLLVEQEKKPG